MAFRLPQQGKHESMAVHNAGGGGKQGGGKKAGKDKNKEG